MSIEKYLLGRMRQAEMKERVEKESDIAEQTKVISVNKTSKQDNQHFSVGELLSVIEEELKIFVN